MKKYLIKFCWYFFKRFSLSSFNSTLKYIIKSSVNFLVKYHIIAINITIESGIDIKIRSIGAMVVERLLII